MASGSSSFDINGGNYRITGNIAWSTSGSNVTFTMTYTTYENCFYSSAYLSNIFRGLTNSKVRLYVGDAYVESGNMFSGYPYGTHASASGWVGINANKTLTKTVALTTGTIAAKAVIVVPNVSTTKNFTLAWAVAYNANGGSGTTSGQMKVRDTALALRSNGFSRDGYEFTGWNTAANGSGTAYAAGASYTGNAALTLYAQWKAVQSTILSVDRNAETLGTIALQMDRKNSAYWHKATFSLDGTTLHTSAAFETSLSTSVPRSWFNNIPNNASITVTLSVQTYTSSACTTTVGSAVTTTITVTADAGMKPTLASGWAAVAPYNTGAAALLGKYIKNLSRAQATFDSSKVTQANGATLASFSITYKGTATSSSPYRTAVLTETSVTVTCTATDSRGRSSSESFALSVEDYSAPTVTRSNIFHCLSDGTADIDGYYLSVEAKIACTSLDGDNTVSATVAVAPFGGSYGTETAITSETPVVLGTYSPDATWMVRITATDTMGTVTVYEEKAAPRSWTLHLKGNGRGAAFGKSAEYNDTFEVNDDWAVKGKGFIDLIYPVGAIYISTVDTYPGTLFGAGTWERIEGKFLLSATDGGSSGASQAAGNTGGSASHNHTTGAHTLTESEIPAHTHGLKSLTGRARFRTVGSGGARLFAGLDGIVSETYPQSASAYPTVAQYGTSSDTKDSQQLYVNASHTHDSFGGSGSHSHGNTGSESTLPPYLSVYMWKRTA